jgi:hypothetical protein
MLSQGLESECAAMLTVGVETNGLNVLPVETLNFVEKRCLR